MTTKLIDSSEMRAGYRCCWACAAWDPGSVGEGGHYSDGICLRHAPKRPPEEPGSEWPITQPDDWCLDFVNVARRYDQQTY